MSQPNPRIPINLRQAMATIGENIKALHLRTKNLETKVGDLSVLTPGQTLTQLLAELKSRNTGTATESITANDVDDKINQAIARLVNGAPENLNQINELVEEIRRNGGGLAGLTAAIGTLSQLKTENKTSLVTALNEVLDKVNALPTAEADNNDYLQAYLDARGSLTS